MRFLRSLRCWFGIHDFELDVSGVYRCRHCPEVRFRDQ